MRIKRQDIDSFKKWLTNQGAEMLQPTNEYELLRFKCRDGTGIVYTGKRGISVNSEIVNYAFYCYKNCSSWDGKPEVKIKRVPMTQRKKRMINRDGYSCFYCGNEFIAASLTVEHMLSIVHGGSNRMENLVLACQECNLEANNLPIIEKVKLRENLRGNSYVGTRED